MVAESVLIVGLATVCEVIDSSLGMMYGTLLAPLLISVGYDAGLVVPSILLSQGLGGLVATLRHDRLGNSNFRGWTRDQKVVITMVLPGVACVFIGVFVAISIPRVVLNTYIGVLVIVMGLLCLRPVYYAFSWRRLIAVGALAGFNKAISGGGFGPVTSTGGILGGVTPKASVGQTTYAEVPICLLAFALWLFVGGSIDWVFAASLCLGALIGSFLGPYITYRSKVKLLRKLIGVVAIGCGAWLLIKILV